MTPRVSRPDSESSVGCRIPLDHVIIVADSATVNGGSAKVAISSALALADLGLVVTFFSGSGPIDSSLHEHPNVRTVCLDQPDILTNPNRFDAAIRGIWNHDSYDALRRILDAADPRRSVVHIHAWTKVLSASALRAAIDSELPVVTTLHEFFAACPIGSFYDHRKAAICSLEAMSSACIRTNCDSRSYPQKVWRVVRQAVQRTSGGLPSKIRHFVTVSAFSERILRPYIDHPEASFHCVPNPIDTPRTDPLERQVGGDFVFVGRLSAEKGAVLFARAASSAGVPASIIGSGECEGDVRTANPDIRFHGWCSPSKTREILRDARALVFPSVWYETAGLVAQEAAALGIPTIVSDVCAAKETVLDGITGLHFRSGDVDDLARALRVCQDDLFVSRLGKAAYDRYWNEPQTMDVHLKKLLAVYAAAMRDVSWEPESA